MHGVVTEGRDRGQGGEGTYGGEVQAGHLHLQLVVSHLLQLAALHLQVGNVALASRHQ